MHKLRGKIALGLLPAVLMGGLVLSTSGPDPQGSADVLPVMSSNPVLDPAPARTIGLIVQEAVEADRPVVRPGGRQNGRPLCGSRSDNLRCRSSD